MRWGVVRAYSYFRVPGGARPQEAQELMKKMETDSTSSHPSRCAIILVLVTFALMYGCEQASSPVEQQEKQAGMEEAKPEEPTPQRMEEEKPKEPAPHQPKEPAQPVVVGNIPIAGIVGENVKGSSFDLRVLDYFRADHYYYAIDRNFEERCTRGVCHVTEDPPYIDIAEEAHLPGGKVRRGQLLRDQHELPED
jgi:hypothetical protein